MYIQKMENNGVSPSTIRGVTYDKTEVFESRTSLSINLHAPESMFQFNEIGIIN